MWSDRVMGRSSKVIFVFEKTVHGSKCVSRDYYTVSRHQLVVFGQSNRETTPHSVGILRSAENEVTSPHLACGITVLHFSV